MRRVLDTDHGTELYRQRQQLIERVFAQTSPAHQAVARRAWRPSPRPGAPRRVLGLVAVGGDLDRPTGSNTVPPPRWRKIKYFTAAPDARKRRLVPLCAGWDFEP